MKTRLAFFIFFCAMMMALGKDVVLPKPIACGKILTFVKTSDEQKVVDLQKAAKANAVDASVAATPDILTLMTPNAKECFLIFELEILTGRTVSVFDYALETDGGQTIECRGMGLTEFNYYDSRLNVVTGPAHVELIFVCPEHTGTVKLKSAFNEIPLPKVGDFIVNAVSLNVEKETEEITDEGVPEATVTPAAE